MSKLTAAGGFVAPITVRNDAGVSFARAMPRFSAIRGGIDFRPPEVKWAEKREREMRALTKMWDWP